MPGLSVLTVIGIVPFAAAAARQAWVKYKITSRRISVQSGVGGQDFTEIVYSDIAGMKFVYRGSKDVGDLVISLAGRREARDALRAAVPGDLPLHL